MKKSSFFGGDISMLGFGLMRLPRVDGMTSDIDYAAASELVDHAMANGVNLFDTAYTYGGSEEFVGRALSKYPRDSYYISTKCPPWKVSGSEDFERIFDEQLQRCKTDYFDFYLVHNMAQEAKRAAGNEEYFERFENIGFYDMLEAKKAKGQIRRIGFSFHGTVTMMQKLVERYEWDFALIQLNYIDWAATDAKSQYEILTSRGIPVMVMEPLRGGSLAHLCTDSAKMLKDADPSASLASWGFRYAASLPNVAAVFSGMNAMDQLEDNIKTMSSFRAVDAREMALLQEAAIAFNKSGVISCTGCGYCLPCPHGVGIARIFSIYNHCRLRGYRIPFDNGYSTLDDSEKASACVGCGVCTEKCPQHLAIPELLREIDEFAKSPV